MKLALGTSWVVAAVGGLAAPLNAVPRNEERGRWSKSLCGTAAGDSERAVYCLVLRGLDDEPQTSTTSAMFVHTSTSSEISTLLPSSITQSTPSLSPTLSFTNNNLEAEAPPSSFSRRGLSDDNLRTIGIIGGLLAGIALLAIIGIILILVRNQRRARSSTASGSTRTRSRTHSRAQQPPQFITRETSDSTFPITRPPPLRIYTGPHAPTVSPGMTSATAGHNGGFLQFPVSSGQGSASSRSTSFGHHSENGAEPPRRPPQIPSLGLSHARPFLRSVASAFSYHASAGHSSHVTQDGDTSATHVTPSLTGSRTLATTEEATRTAPVDAPSEHSAKLSTH